MKVWHSTAEEAWPPSPSCIPPTAPYLQIPSRPSCSMPASSSSSFTTSSSPHRLTSTWIDLSPLKPSPDTSKNPELVSTPLPYLPRLLHSVAVVHSFTHSFIDVCTDSDSTQSNNPATMCLSKLHSPGHAAESISMLSVLCKKNELQFEHMDFYALTGGGPSVTHHRFFQTRTGEKRKPNVRLWLGHWLEEHEFLEWDLRDLQEGTSLGPPRATHVFNSLKEKQN